MVPVCCTRGGIKKGIFVTGGDVYGCVVSGEDGFGGGVLSLWNGNSVSSNLT